MERRDTIAAIATGLTNSGIGIVRVSGEEAIEIVDRIFVGRVSLQEKQSHSISYGYIVKDGERIDEVLVMLMKGPRTYTGEDTVEINCHGGALILQKVLRAVLESGGRIADPGEFTKRAFLNGKVDISKAEAVMDIIEAKNDYALKAGMNQLTGGLRKEITDIRAALLHEIAFIEAALDDPEHYTLDEYPAALEEIIYGEIKKIDTLLETIESGRIIKEGIDTVILGKPNAGKSSLLNLLTRSERAIVTDIAGTTRDILTENIKMAGISLNITDTAGIRETPDIVEKIGVEKAMDIAKEADLILCMIDAGREISKEDIKILEFIQDKKAIILLNKVDEENICIDAEMLLQYSNKKSILFSTKEGIGLKELQKEIEEMFFQGNLEINDEIIVTNLRHKEALEGAKTSLEMVLSSIEAGMPEDFFSIDLLNAYEELGKITGETLEEDVVNEIFAKFCMGK